ncbi:MAG: hypothetical protein EOP84_03480 [Verrucomicrobiaceae bacterium]|nr:MAG: hypothetical protein EOP84_03480 [Verrucomicrobiaceae bacterium]
MSEVLNHVYNACNPLQPASHEQYVDCSSARGSSALAVKFRKELSRTEQGRFLRFLFSGHIGSGKSSELMALHHLLEHDPINDRCYLPVYLDAGEYLDDYDVNPTDILLAIATELADTLRLKVGIELEDSYLKKRINEIKGFFMSEVEINEGELPLGAAKVKVQRLREDPTARQLVRDKLAKQTTNIIQEINLLLDEVRIKLSEKKVAVGGRSFYDVVLILDNLEKIQRFEEANEGVDSQHQLFVESAPQLTAINAHVIYTVPLPLVRSTGPQLERIYGNSPFVLPMVKVERRGSHAEYEPGRLVLRSLLQRRLGEVRVEDVFTTEALDWLITYSGGHVRDLMVFVQQATTETDNVPITLHEARQALRQTIGSFSTSIQKTWWTKLAELELSSDQHIDSGDADFQQMLSQVVVMEYLNGDDAMDIFSDAAPWYAVNPIVRELRQFKDAVAARNQANT